MIPTISAGLGFTPPTEAAGRLGSQTGRIPGPKMASQAFIDDDHTLCVLRVVLSELRPRRNGISSVRKYPGVIAKNFRNQDVRSTFSGGLAASCTGVPG